jgi:hypothetical protein
LLPSLSVSGCAVVSCAGVVTAAGFACGSGTFTGVMRRWALDVIAHSAMNTTAINMVWHLVAVFLRLLFIFFLIGVESSEK